jgi:hypothetical protein
MAPFPPILAVVLGALAAAFVVRHITREWQRAKDIDREAKASVAKARDENVPKKLRRDPDGIYRP